MANLRFNLDIECENAAFHEATVEAEIVRILHIAAERVMREGWNEKGYRADLYDSNGNVVGEMHTYME